MGWSGGGLFDYSVFSWTSFSQERIQTRVGPGKDQDLDQELDKKHKDLFCSDMKEVAAPHMDHANSKAMTTFTREGVEH